MPPFGPMKRADLIRGLRALGYSGPYAGGQHSYMERGGVRLHIPNPHQADISVGLLARILRRGGISREAWESV